MSASSVDKEFVRYVVDLMQSIGPVYPKSMFGGHGVFLDELMFSLIYHYQKRYVRHVVGTVC